MKQHESLTNVANLTSSPLGEIAVALPGATAVFLAAGLDYCCGGQTTLKDAVAARSLDLDQIVAELRKLNQDQRPAPADLDTGSLIELIVSRFHRAHSREIPELIRLAQRVEAVHEKHASVPAGLADLLKRMLGELTIHMQKEELVLFPRMKNGGAMPLQFPIATMMAEHREHGAHLEEIRRLTNGLRVPDDGCATWRALYAGVSKFADDLVEHIHTENNILFPRFQEKPA